MCSPLLYDAFMRPLGALGLDAWRRELLSGLDGQRILEIGTGSGLLLEHAAGPRPSVAIDIDARSLARARRRAPHVQFLEASAEALPFAEHAFDAIVASLVFCSIEDPARAARELHRVVRPGGRVRLLDHVRVEGVPGRIQDLLTPAWKLLSGGCRLNRSPRQLLLDAGFTLERETAHARGYVRFVEARRRSE